MLGTGVPGAVLSWPEPLCKTEQGEDAAVQGSRERRIGALGRQEGSQHRHQRQLHSQGLPEEPSQQEPGQANRAGASFEALWESPLQGRDGFQREFLKQQPLKDGFQRDVPQQQPLHLWLQPFTCS